MLYAWKETRVNNAKEYLAKVSKYRNDEKRFKRYLKRKYGSTCIMSLADIGEMPTKPSQVSYSKDTINLHVYPKGVGYPIMFTRQNLGTERDLWNWVLHLCRKPWVTGKIIFDFVELVSKTFDVKVPWDFERTHEDESLGIREAR